MSEIKPEIPTGLEEDLQSESVTIQYLDKGKLKTVQGLRGSMTDCEGAMIELRPHIVVAVEESDADTCTYAQKILATIPLEDIVAIEIQDAENPYIDPLRPVASWIRDSSGKLRFFQPQT